MEIKVNSMNNVKLINVYFLIYLQIMIIMNLLHKLIMVDLLKVIQLKK